MRWAWLYAAAVALCTMGGIAWAVNQNPIPGSVWTWLGPTYGADRASYPPGSLGFAQGNQSGTTTWINQYMEMHPGDLAAMMAGLYAVNTSAWVGFSTIISAAKDPTGSGYFNPGDGIASLVTNAGSKLQGVAVHSICNVTASGVDSNHPGTCFGGNDVATAAPGLTNVQLIGREIDVEANGNGTLSTIQQSRGLQINAYGQGHYGSGIEINSGDVVHADWNAGLECGNIAGPCVTAVNGTLNSLIDTGTPDGAYRQGAIIMRNTHGMVWVNSAGTASSDWYMSNGGTGGNDVMHIEASPGGGGIDLKAGAASQHVLVRGPQDMSAGVTLSSVNDLNTQIYPMEIQASPLLVSGPFRISGAVVSALPPCNSASKLYMWGVTDANAPAWNAVVAGGGSSSVLVMCDGTNWRVH
jgi:hypothetical protein